MKTDFALKYLFISSLKKNPNHLGPVPSYFFSSMTWSCISVEVFSQVCFLYFCFLNDWGPNLGNLLAGGSITPRDEKALKNRWVWCEGPCWSLQLYEKREATRLSCKCHGLFSTPPRPSKKKNIYMSLYNYSFCFPEYGPLVYFASL